MTHKEQVEKKIRELVPELQELSVGCHLRDKANNVVCLVCKERPWQKTVQVVDWSGWLSVGAINTHFEIIGHPIELRHVLRAIQESARWVFLGVAEDKLFFSRRKLANGESIEEGEPISYNLTLPFSDQDPALYEFLHSILCGKE